MSRETEVWLCCGVGGAGKTTTSAALAVAHARAGARVIVLTIDPARRLADALGLELAANAPVQVPLGPDVPGTLHGLMLDRKATWDAAVRRHADDPAVVEALLANRYYRAVSTKLTGGHEHMATETLHALVEDGSWDVIVVDTPPARHALDFFRAPERIQRLLDRRVAKALFRPPTGLLGFATRNLLQLVKRLAGGRVLDDLQDFFSLVTTLSEGFRVRGEQVDALLRSEACRYVLVANARAPREADLLDFLHVLRDEGRRFGGFVLNRATPPPPLAPSELAERLGSPPDGTSAEDWSALTDALRQILSDRAEAHSSWTAGLAKLHAAAPTAPAWALPDVDVREALPALVRLSAHLPPFAEGTVAESPPR